MRSKMIVGAGVVVLLIVLLKYGLNSGRFSTPVLTSPIISKPAIVIPTITPMPTVAIGKNSNLLEEVEKLSPESFSADYSKLHQEASNF